MKRLTELSLDDPCAESVIYLLHRRSLAGDRTPEVDAAATRFLDAATPFETWVAAVWLVEGSSDERIQRALVAASSGPDDARAVRASFARLAFHGDDAGFRHLQRRLLSAQTGLSFRRNLSFSLAEFAPLRPKEVRDGYISLLSDDDIWMRYNAFHVLRLISGETFNFSYREIATGNNNKRAIQRWRDWSSSCPITWRPLGNPEPQQLGGVDVFLRKTDQAVNDGLVVVGNPPDFFPGDAVVAIDGDSVEGKTWAELLRYELRGKPGSVIKFKVRSSTGALRELQLVRRDLSEPPAR